MQPRGQLHPRQVSITLAQTSTGTERYQGLRSTCVYCRHDKQQLSADNTENTRMGELRFFLI